MATIAVKKNKNKTVLKIDGSASIEHVTELKQELAKHLSKSESMDLDLEGVTSADIAFLQLLDSLCKTALEEDKTVNVIGDSRNLKDLYAETGFFRHKHCVFFPEKPCLLHNRGNRDEGGRR